MNNDFGIYYISLETDYKRRESLYKKFPIEFTNMTHIQAIDGREQASKDYFKRLSKYYIETRKIISPGEVGCILSHIRAMEEFLKSKNDFALILEDDIIGADDDIQKVRNIFTHINNNSFIHCGGMDGRTSSKYIFGEKSDLGNIYKLPIFSQRHLWRACSYVITRESAKIILDIHKKNVVVADNWSIIFKDTGLNIYASNIFHHPIDLSDSTLESSRQIILQNVSIINFKIFIKVFNRTRNIIYSLFYKSIGYSRVFPN